MRKGIMIGMFGVALCAAGTAQAGAPEARNPFHCSVALQVAHELVTASQGPDSELAREIHGRLVWQAFAAAHFPRMLDSDLEATQLRALFSADSGAGLAMAEACMIRQDAHPRFRAARLDRQIRDGFAKENVSGRAALAELRQLYNSPSREASARQ